MKKNIDRIMALGSANSAIEEKANSYLKKMQDVEIKIRERACKKIKFSQPIIKLGNVGIVYPNALTVIQGQKGVHKSRLTENFCAALLSRNRNRDFIGFTVEPLLLFQVAYIDTERNLNDQLPYAMQRIKETAGLESETHPENFNTVSLIEIERSGRFDAIREYLDQVRKANPERHIVVVLDVITDCIGSFNDPKESMILLDHLNMMINTYNVSFICVIHENPNSFGDAKARGHLGTELINKATTVISIGYEKGSNGNFTDLIALKFLHTRNSKKPEPHYLKYSEEAKGLVVADASFVQEQKDLKSEKAQLGELKDWLRENLMGEQPKMSLTETLTTYFGCSDKTVDTRLKELVKGDDPFLLRSKRGKEVLYSLNPHF